MPRALRGAVGVEYPWKTDKNIGHLDLTQQTSIRLFQVEKEAAWYMYSSFDSRGTWTKSVVTTT